MEMGRKPKQKSEANLKNMVRKAYTYSLILIQGICLDSLGTKPYNIRNRKKGRTKQNDFNLVELHWSLMCLYLV